MLRERFRLLSIFIRGLWRSVISKKRTTIRSTAAWNICALSIMVRVGKYCADLISNGLVNGGMEHYFGENQFAGDLDPSL